MFPFNFSKSTRGLPWQQFRTKSSPSIMFEMEKSRQLGFELLQFLEQNKSLNVPAAPGDCGADGTEEGTGQHAAEPCSSNGNSSDQIGILKSITVGTCI